MSTQNSKQQTKYQSYGQTSFSFPFVINNSNAISVWLNDDLQTLSNYQINFNPNQDGGVVVFNNPVGTTQRPIVVTLNHIPELSRVTDFLDFTSVRASNLNYEFDNLVSIMECIDTSVATSVQQSNLETNSCVILPPSKEGKGLFWGESGKLLNTDLNLNDILNAVALANPSLPSSQILASKIVVDVSNTTIKKDNLQDFLTVTDSTLTTLNTNQNSILQQLDTFTQDINTLTKTCNTNSNNITTLNQNIISNSNTITQVNDQITNLQQEVSSIMEQVKKINTIQPYTIVSTPKDNTNQPNYLIYRESFVFDIVNVRVNSPLIFNFVKKGVVTQTIITDIATQIQNSQLYCVGAVSGRYFYMQS